jgi:hypothetical protein
LLELFIKPFLNNIEKIIPDIVKMTMAATLGVLDTIFEYFLFFQIILFFERKV